MSASTPMTSSLLKVDTTVDNLTPEDQLHIQLKAVCRQLLPGWDEFSDAGIQVSVVSGGISNALFKLSTASPTAQPVLVRVYGRGSEKFVNRSKEILNMQLLHAHGFGPALLGLFANGRIESFLPMTCLSPEEMVSPSLVPLIAENLARMHAVAAPNKPEGGAAPTTPFGRIREWLAIVRGLDFSDDPAKAAAFAAFDIDELLREVNTVEGAAAPLQSPLVFGHNDLLSGNIMVAPQNGATAMTFIDFEYADWAPRGFDIGNHFCEYAGFECDYSRYPAAAAAAAFLRPYLAAAGGTEVEDAAVKRATAEANVFALAAHQYWGTWALMQARWSLIDFDFMGYAALRWGEFRRRRDEFLAEAAEAAKSG